MQKNTENTKENIVEAGSSQSAQNNGQCNFYSKHKKPIIMAGAIIAVAVIALVLWLSVFKEDKTAEQEIVQETPDKILDEEPNVKYTGRMYLNSINDDIKVGDSFTTDILADTYGTNILAVEIKIYYDPEKVEFIEWQNDDSVLSLQAVEEIKENYISIVRGEPGDSNPQDIDDGFTGADGLLARAVWKAKSAGQAEFSFDNQVNKMAVDDGKASFMELEFGGMTLDIID